LEKTSRDSVGIAMVGLILFSSTIPT
jgi:hypothetical protein